MKPSPRSIPPSRHGSNRHSRRRPTHSAAHGRISAKGAPRSWRRPRARARRLRPFSGPSIRSCATVWPRAAHCPTKRWSCTSRRSRRFRTTFTPISSARSPASVPNSRARGCRLSRSARPCARAIRRSRSVRRCASGRRTSSSPRPNRSTSCSHRTRGAACWPPRARSSSTRSTRSPRRSAAAISR